MMLNTSIQQRITITMTKRTKLVGSILLLAIILTVSIFSYRVYRKNHGVYVETVKQGDGWGYKIYVKGKLVINQPMMPAIPSGKPFPCEKAAQKTAELVVQKVGRKQLPTVTTQEVNKILQENCE